MGKKRIHERSAIPEERAAEQIERNNGGGGGYAARLGVSAREGGADVPPAQETVQPLPGSHRELGGAILSGRDPVTVGRELLDKSDDRGAATRLRALETFADWAYGKPAPAGTSGRVRIIWDIPLPAHKTIHHKPQELEGGEK